MENRRHLPLTTMESIAMGAGYGDDAWARPQGVTETTPPFKNQKIEKF